MKYIVNDIENIVLLNNIGVFNKIPMVCSTMAVTNLRMSRFSSGFNEKLHSLYTKGLTKVEIDVGIYEWYQSNKSVLSKWGIGYASSIYLAQKEDSLLVSDNFELHKLADSFGVKCIFTEDFAKLCKVELRALELFINHKTV